MNENDLPKLSFEEAFNYMQTGTDVKIPSWKGFWRWCEEKKTILLFTAQGDVMDIRESPDIRFTLNFTFMDHWVKVKSDDQLSPECVAARNAYDAANR